MLLLRPPPISDMQATLIPFIDVAYSAGVRHIVFLSVAGAERSTWVPHREVELHLDKRGTEWAILRPGCFAQNLTDAYYKDIVEDHRLYVPAGDGKVAFIDVRDVGACRSSARRCRHGACSRCSSCRVACTAGGSSCQSRLLRIASIQPQQSTTSIASFGVIERSSELSFVDLDPHLVRGIAMLREPAMETVRGRERVDLRGIDDDGRYVSPTYPAGRDAT